MYPKYLIFAMICIKLYSDSCRQVWNVKNTVFWGWLIGQVGQVRRVGQVGKTAFLSCYKSGGYKGEK